MSNLQQHQKQSARVNIVVEKTECSLAEIEQTIKNEGADCDVHNVENKRVQRRVHNEQKEEIGSGEEDKHGSNEIRTKYRKSVVNAFECRMK